jgi:hypothetical protein
MHIRSVSARMFLAAAIFGAAVTSGPAIPRAHAAPLTDAENTAKYNCDRACLQGVADLYYKSLAAHDPSLLPLAPDAKYSETGSVVKIGDGLWRTVSGAPSYRLEIDDPQSGGIGLDAVLPDNGAPTIVATRLKVENHKVTEIETVMVHKGEKAVFQAPERLTQPSAHFTTAIPAAERNSRYELMAAADGYFRAFQTEGTPDYIRAPLIPETLRVENGMQATNVATSNHAAIDAASQFDQAIFKDTEIYDRRYPVVDVEHGVVLALVRFRRPGPSRAGLVSDRGDAVVAEFFSIQQGKIVEIQATWIQPPQQVVTPW